MTVGHGACYTACQWKIRAEHLVEWGRVINTQGARTHISHAPLLTTERVEARTIQHFAKGAITNVVF